MYKKSQFKFWILLLLACTIGYLLGKVDTSKNWNDTGVIVGLVLISCFILSYLMKKFAWLWAIIIGGLIFCFDVLPNGNYGAAGAILFAFLGAYSGVFFRKYIFIS